MKYGPKPRRQGSLLPLSGHNDPTPRNSRERPLPSMETLLARAQEHMALRKGQRLYKDCRCFGKCECVR